MPGAERRAIHAAVTAHSRAAVGEDSTCLGNKGGCVARASESRRVV